MPETTAPTSTGGSATALTKRDADPAAPAKPVLAKRSKTLAHGQPRKYILDLTDEPLFSAPPSDAHIGEVPLADTPIIHASFSKGQESDSSPKVTAGYSATYLDLPYILPGGYEVTDKSKLGKALDDFLRNHGTTYNEKRTATEQALVEIAKCKDLEAKNVKLEGETQESANKAVEEYRASEAYHDELGEETAYFLCRFVKTFKDINPSLALHYQEFINGYPSRWFSSLDLNAPLSPMEGEGNEGVSKAQGQP
ncbi:hypothetical protein LIER_14860 [Lithospermum erythrorhizon]|uniref:Uncharacterized protein n=1 Tax=Lithospermum erythrorhizon TaxID=34254 RepID=A0AAV3Q5W9_LITER